MLQEEKNFLSFLPRSITIIDISHVRQCTKKINALKKIYFGVSINLLLFEKLSKYLSACKLLHS